MRVLASLLLLSVTSPAAFGADPTGQTDPEIAAMVAAVDPARIEADIRTLAGFHTRHTLSDTTSDTTGIGAARRWIKAEFERISAATGGRLQVEFDAFQQPPTPPRMPEGGEIVNVVATLPGTQSGATERIYVVSGHYDSRSLGIMDADTHAPGANDDASGTAAVLELARVMSAYEFDAIIVFMAVAAEEQGLQGARHWANTAVDTGKNVAAMFTNDIVGNTTDEKGRIDRSHVRLFAEGVPPAVPMTAATRNQIRTGGENDFPTRQLARLVKTVGEAYVTGFEVRVIYRRDRFLRGGDHSPFLDVGVPAVRFTEPREAFARQHQNVRLENGVQYGDLPDFVDFAYTAQVARINAATLATLARAPAAPADVQVEVTRLENDTVLRWTRGTEPDLAGYRVVWRETTAPFWQHSAWAGDVTRHVVEDISKDNFIFGVQAVDTAGHASPAVYPTPWTGDL